MNDAWNDYNKYFDKFTISNLVQKAISTTTDAFT